MSTKTNGNFCSVYSEIVLLNMPGLVVVPPVTDLINSRPISFPVISEEVTECFCLWILHPVSSSD